MTGLKGSTLAILTEGMGGRLKTKGGQLVPLKQRMNAHQQAVREGKIRARATVAAQLIGQMNLMQRQIHAFVQMGPIQRWKLRRLIRKTAAA